MIWFDLDNSPHVPLFVPIFDELKKREQKHFITARDFAQTIELCRMWKIDYHLIGKHGGKNKFKKIFNTYNRAKLLKNEIKDKNIKLAVSHGSRAQVIASKKMGIPSILMMDYEHTEKYIFNWYADYLLIPIFIPDKILKESGINLKKVIRYNGFKEELYLNGFKPEDNFREKLNIRKSDFLVVIRPPSLVGNYRKKESETLFIEAIKFFTDNNDIKCLIISRTKEDLELIKKEINNKKNLLFLETTVNGLQLLYTADIVLSGGGTMNRESALLGTRTYSIFKGNRPYLDKYLTENGRLKFVDNIDDIKKIKIEKLNKELPEFKNNIRNEVIDIFLNINK